MSNGVNNQTTKIRKEKTKELTSYLLHKHYCENDEDALIEHFDEYFSWLGTGEQEYAVGYETVKDIFRKFSGKVIKCNISDECYDVIEAAPDVYVCSGRLWISTDPSTQTYLRVHQRITTVFRWRQERPYCCHSHISNPYTEMASDDVGFPTGMARQFYEYMQKCIESQKKQIEAQTAELDSIYNSIPCAIIRVLRKGSQYSLLTYNRATAELLEKTREATEKADWSSGFSNEVLREDAAKIQSALQTLKKPGDYASIDYRLRTRSGKLVYLSSNNLLVSESDDGQVIQRIAFDITKQMELQAILERKSFEDSLTGLFNRNKFNQLMHRGSSAFKQLGIAYFDVNGLKTVNDQSGHSAGDTLLRRVALHINKKFNQKAYRIGGDEFVVIDDSMDETSFINAVSFICKEMNRDKISISVGFSWRCSPSCNLKEQYDEADKLMYKDKAAFYSQKLHDRRKK